MARKLPTFLLLAMLAGLPACLDQPTDASGPLVPYGGWLVPPEGCPRDAIQRPLAVGDLPPAQFRLSHFIPPPDKMQFRNLTASEWERINESAVASIPTLQGRKPDRIESFIEPSMRGGIGPYGHDGDWTLILRFFMNGSRGVDEHGIGINRADDDPHTYTPEGGDSTLTYDRPDLFELSYGATLRAVPDDWIHRANETILAWMNATDEIPDEYRSTGEADWAPGAGTCIRVVLDKPLPPELWMGHGECVSRHTVWVDAEASRFVKLEPSPYLWPECPF